MTHRVVFVIAGGAPYIGESSYRDNADRYCRLLQNASTDTRSIVAFVVDTHEQGLCLFDASDESSTLVFMSSFALDTACHVLKEQCGRIHVLVLCGHPKVGAQPGDPSTGEPRIVKLQTLGNDFVGTLLPHVVRTV